MGSKLWPSKTSAIFHHPLVSDHHRNCSYVGTHLCYSRYLGIHLRVVLKGFSFPDILFLSVGSWEGRSFGRSVGCIFSTGKPLVRVCVISIDL